MKGSNPSKLECTRKNFRKLFKNYNFETNTKTVQFLDITLDITSGLYYFYYKPNENSQCVYSNSDHTRIIINQNVNNMSIRVSKLFANKEIFENISDYYNETLSRSGYSVTITCAEPQTLKITLGSYTIIVILPENIQHSNAQITIARIQIRVCRLFFPHK